MKASLSPNLDSLRFDNRFVRDLPADAETGNFIRQVRGACYSRVQPKKAINPRLVAYSREMAATLDLSEAACRSPEFTQVFAGNRLLDGMEPFAMAYGGHQFGVWAGQLGDGRVINLGDVINSQGERWALQLKGAGRTPYSRMADGLAVLRSSVREFLCSEAMFHLGVPTTRALSLILTGETVIRDMFYNGNPKAEPGAVVCRVAPSFIRFGHFQFCTAQGDRGLLVRFANHTIRTYFPHLGEPSPEVYLAWFKEICQSTARLIVEWERVGFVHGVMNTDNMSILGLTIDYGPYGWLEDYDPDWTPNTTDAEERRYRFGNQPAIAYWNLVQLANALFPLIKKEAPLQTALHAFVETYEQERRVMFNRKLGLLQNHGEKDEQLQETLLKLLRSHETDMTLFYRLLAKVELPSATERPLTATDAIRHFSEAFYDLNRIDETHGGALCAWLMDYRCRVEDEKISETLRRERMDAVNPLYVFRNYLAQLAIDKAENGDFGGVSELLETLRRPYQEQPGREQYAAKRPDWAKLKPGCSMLSCSS